jgi:hypothetical protein
MSAVFGNGGSSGMGGTAGRLSFTVSAGVVLAFVGAAGAEFCVAAGAVAAGGAANGLAPVGQAGAALSAASVALFVVVKGGTPSGAELAPIVAVAPEGTGPLLIFTNKYVPTPSRITIVISGRIEPIDRPP